MEENLPAEFGLIMRHFRPLAGPGALDLRDDAAELIPPAGRHLVLTADAMVGGVHFLADDPPDRIGQKLLRVNLSDLAAKGATPLGYLMTVSCPRGTPEAWYAGFAAGLARDQAQYGITLLGGDTTSTPGPVSLSLTAIGHIAPGQGVHRFGAGPGDGIWVTGTIGDGALGLAVAQRRLVDPTGYLLDRYRLPQPRVGLAIGGVASAGMDVSDGLIQDLGHICRASGLTAEVEAGLVPLSAAARTVIGDSGVSAAKGLAAEAAKGAAAKVAAAKGGADDMSGQDWLETCLTGGDDYEVLMAVPPAREPALHDAARAIGVPVTRIGIFQSGPPRVMVRDADGNALMFKKGGWSHF